jgi:hypothetical protein
LSEISKQVDGISVIYLLSFKKEKKRGKRQEVIINECIREDLAEYLAAYPGIGEKWGYEATSARIACVRPEAIKRGR